VPEEYSDHEAWQHGVMPKLSAGLLVFRVDGDGMITVLLVHPGGPFWRNKDVHAWSIPKGEYEPGEDAQQAAEREFEEELGLSSPDGPRIDLGTIRQSGGKQVRAWAVRADSLSIDAVVSNTFDLEWPPRSGAMQSFPEIDLAEWVSVPEATVRLVSAQVEFLHRLGAALNPGPG
jgi:predicted NUDIX family NTP pyrophosphohydrolase